MKQNRAATLTAFVKAIGRRRFAAASERRSIALAWAFAACVVVQSVPASQAWANGWASVWANAPNNAFLNFGVPGQGGALNHHIVPDEAIINQDGIVNFAVVSGAAGAGDGGGFHQITVYKVAKNTTADDILDQIRPGTSYQVFDRAGTLVLSVTAGAARVDSDPSGLRVFIEAAASNTPRIVGVFFDEPGTYLVICNVRAHFDDGMVAIVTVKRGSGLHDTPGH